MDKIKIQEINEKGEIINTNVWFQIDENYLDKGCYSLAILISKDNYCAESKNKRIYRLLSDNGSGINNYRKKLVKAIPFGLYRGQESYKIISENATYYYHVKGAGFASIIDEYDRDWISYNEKKGPEGEYRGLPNAGYPEKYFHPGQGDEGCISKILSNGPLKVSIYSESSDCSKAVLWNIYPYFAECTFIKCQVPYWFLYEGTPAGFIDPDNGYMVFSDGKSELILSDWEKKLPSPRWIYFSDKKVNNMFFLLQHEEDGEVDSYWAFKKHMTVFGFGRSREGLIKTLRNIPAKYTIGFGNNNFKEAKAYIESFVEQLSYEIIFYEV